MISAAVNSLSPDFSGLTAEISKSVSHIRAKAAALHLNSPETAGTENVNGFQLNGCAVSYLEPQSLFAVQKFVSEAGEGERLNRQPRQKNVFNEEGKNAPEIGQAETPVSFWEELASSQTILVSPRPVCLRNRSSRNRQPVGLPRTGGRFRSLCRNCL